MGYTHYWYLTKKDIDLTTWKAILEDFNNILEYMKKDNRMDYPKVEIDYKEDYQIDNTVLRFNGIGDDSHETFYVERENKEDFSFCKTANKPYDVVVQIALIVLKHHLQESIKVTSDGNREDWMLANTIFSRFKSRLRPMKEKYPQYEMIEELQKTEHSS